MSSVPGLAPGAALRAVALTVRQQNMVVRLEEDGLQAVFRPKASLCLVAEGETVSIQVQRAWTFGRTRYVSGSIQEVHLDVTAWGLPPLALQAAGPWDLGEYHAATPADQYLRAIRQVGPRQAFEMEQVLPGSDPGDPDQDPIIAALDARDMGDWDKAYAILQACLLEDLRCIDAHTHLGHFSFGDGTSEWGARQAFKHYSVGVAVGDRALGPGFDGVLPWVRIDNRPFLRCLHGLSLAAWRLGKQEMALRALERLLWLDPSDPIGASALLAPVRAGQSFSAEDVNTGH